MTTRTVRVALSILGASDPRGAMRQPNEMAPRLTVLCAALVAAYPLNPYPHR